MSIPYKYQQILQLLRENREGLTTAQLVALCKKMPLNDVKDSKECNRILYTQRNSNQVSTKHTENGDVHKITKKGLDRLIKEIGDDSSDIYGEKMVKAADEIITDIQELPVKTYPLREITEPDDEKNKKFANTDDLITEFDQAIEIIRATIITSLNARAALRIDDRDNKIKLLQSMAAMPIFTQDIADLLTSIANDLEHIDETS